MAPKRSFRDRFFTPPVAKAIMSPLGILLAGAGAAIGIVVGLPVAGVVAVGGAAWAARVAVAVPRDAKGDRIDPFALGEPWRRFVSDALGAQKRFSEAVHRADPGPLRDRMAEIGQRIDQGLDDCWRVAQRGFALADARGHINTTGAQRELDDVKSEFTGPTSADSPAARTIQSLQAQLASAARMDGVIKDTRDRLRLLNARLDEAVARAYELSVQADDVADLTGLSDDVDGVVGDMEALREGLDEAEGQAATGTS